jgi:hypothetical protein
MAVIDLNIRKQGPYHDGESFGDTGPYERIDAQVRFAVDPEHPANQAIVDLALAPRDEQGRVQFTADLCLLRPALPGRGNRRLMLELPNRGRKGMTRQFNRAPADPSPTNEIHPGDGFLFRRGFTLGWIAWQWDVIRGETLMALDPPIAMQDGKPIHGQIAIRFQTNEFHKTHLLADRVHRPYPTADISDPMATLTVRDFDDDPPRTIPRDQWQFAREQDGTITPDDTHVYLASGFEPGHIYELVYTTNHSPVVGAGLLALRDAASFLHYGHQPSNPLAGTIDYVYGHGVSQTGRMLRHFLSLGLNQDEQGRMALDGVLPHVGGARRGEFNHRFGQPSVQYTPSFGHRPPFDDASLLARQRAVGSLPKIVQTNSSAEYWRGDCALLHIDTSGQHDLLPDPATRIYHFAGTQHGPGVVPHVDHNPNDGARGRYRFNSVDYSPLLRAALINLDRWVTAGVAPPANAHPRLDDGTAVTRDQLLEQFPDIPGLHRPDPAKILRICRVDLGPQEDEGIGRFPATEGERFPTFVPATDEDGNERAGIRLPDLTVPVATMTGWNPRHPDTGAPDLIVPMQGSTFYFAATQAEREEADDPRPSIEERYPSRDAYLARVREAACELERQRYVLAEDIDLIVANAAERYDEATGNRGTRVGAG